MTLMVSERNGLDFTTTTNDLNDLFYPFRLERSSMIGIQKEPEDLSQQPIREKVINSASCLFRHGAKCLDVFITLFFNLPWRMTFCVPHKAHHDTV